MIKELKEHRFRLLNALYQFTEGNTRIWTNMKELCQSQGIPFEDKAYNYLMDEGLINPYGSAYTCFLSHDGVKAIEEAWDNPNSPTYYFPAVADISPLNGK